MLADKEEEFDLVDEQDRVVGRELRSVVHRTGEGRHLAWEQGGTVRSFSAADCMHADPALASSGILACIHRIGCQAGTVLTAGLPSLPLRSACKEAICTCPPAREALPHLTCPLPAARPALPAGLLHRAVYVWVFREQDGALLVQRRSAAKKIGPSQWDLSVAEHLQPGESYLQVGERVGGVGRQAGMQTDRQADSQADSRYRYR